MRYRFTRLTLVLVAAAGLGSAGGLRPAHSQVDTVTTKTGTVQVENVAGGLEHPWGMAFLPDRRLLVTERPGRLRIVGTDGSVSEPVSGTPEVFDQGQGGLLDVKLDPDFAQNRLVYFTYAEAGDGGASTAVGRGRFENDRIEGFEVIFRQQPKVSGPNHFGSRLVFTTDGHLFVTLGERFKFEPAQDRSGHLGKVIRVNRNGTVPADNPFVDQEGVRPEIWSYGHRNIQAAAINPRTGALWIAEMGPRGGDEINLPEPSRNYGWPLVSWGNHYDGKDIPDPPTRPDLADTIHRWAVTIAPSGMLFYEGDLFSQWRGNVLIGSLAQEALVRLVVDGSKVIDEEIIPMQARIRDVEQGPDGTIYVLTDSPDGNVWRLSPQSP